MPSDLILVVGRGQIEIQWRTTAQRFQVKGNPGIDFARATVPVAVQMNIEKPGNTFNGYRKLLLLHGDPVAGRR